MSDEEWISWLSADEDIDDEELIASTELTEVQMDSEANERPSDIYFANITLSNLNEVLNFGLQIILAMNPNEKLSRKLILPEL